MNTTAVTFERRISALWKSLALVAIASLALDSGVLASGGTNPFADNGDTVGSHPDKVIAGSGSDVQWRTMFFVEGPAMALTSAGLQLAGDGVEVEPLVNGNIRLEFDASSTVRLDLDLFNDTRVSTGFRVAQYGSATRLRWQLGTHNTAATNVAPGTDIELPVTRLRRSGLLDQGLAIETYHRRTQRTGYSVTNEAGSLVITRR